ncbi:MULTISPECIES: hypothetical protein [Thalassospira]|uniref:hypothetical protein n=1 Tax=Thalassospira TaxID=168934 RepID=UPI0008DCD8F0|nr:MULTISPECIES: hypothetical protein [Thalassospira]MDM7975399.1 hypothetical protein [Thalassospira xiamenensis]OHZ00832.1 hypothetical protein BC440_08230 [Thalassospira sp. MIT1004]
MSEKRQLTQMMHIRTTPGVYNLLAQMAAKEGISLPSLCRKMWNQAIFEAYGKPLSPVIVPATRRETAPEDVQQLRGLRADLARLTGALVQAAIRCRETDAHALHSAVEAAINDNKQIGCDIDQVLRRLA